MLLICRCEGCGSQFKLDAEKFGGKKLKCPKCDKLIVVPLANSPAAKPLANPSGPPNSAPAPKAPVQKPPAAAPLAAEQGDDPFAVVRTALPAKPAAAPLPSPLNASSSFKQLTRILVGAGLVLVLALAIGFYAGNQATHQDREQAKAEGDRAKPISATLVLNWGVMQREGAQLLVDGKGRVVPPNGPVELTLSPGTHEIVVRRHGFDAITEKVTLKSGEHKAITPIWRALDNALASNPFNSKGTPQNPGGAANLPVVLPPATYDDWLQDFDAACKKAAAENKDVFIAFVDSSNEVSEDLAHRVFFRGEFRREADAKFVLVLIDTPLEEDGATTVENKDRNAELRKKMRVRDLPAILLADRHGAVYAAEDDEKFVSGTAEEFGKRVVTWQENRSARDRVLAAASKGAPQERLDGACLAVEWLRNHRILPFHAKQMKDWLKLAQEVDPENKRGKLEILYINDWAIRLGAGEFEKSGTTKEAVAEFAKWVRTHPLKQGDAAVNALMYCAAWLASNGYPTEAGECLDVGVKSPGISSYNKNRLAGMRSGLKQLSRQVLSSGTGYMVDERGYLLTNNHVIDGPGRVFVRLASGEVAAKIIAVEKNLDMALLKLEPPEGVDFKPLVIEDAVSRRGSPVAAFGFPLGDAAGSEIKLTTGVVSALPESKNDGMYILDCRVNPGNSGGPLCDKQGRVIGMITAKTYSGGSIESYGMARPASDLVPFVRKHLPDFEGPQSNPKGETLDWDQVDQLVSSSVVMILKKL